MSINDWQAMLTRIVNDAEAGRTSPDQHSESDETTKIIESQFPVQRVLVSRNAGLACPEATVGANIGRSIHSNQVGLNTQKMTRPVLQSEEPANPCRPTKVTE